MSGHPHVNHNFSAGAYAAMRRGLLHPRSPDLRWLKQRDLAALHCVMQVRTQRFGSRYSALASGESFPATTHRCRTIALRKTSTSPEFACLQADP